MDPEGTADLALVPPPFVPASMAAKLRRRSSSRSTSGIVIDSASTAASAPTWVLPMSEWKSHRMFSSRVMRSIADRPPLSCAVAARTYRTRSTGMSGRISPCSRNALVLAVMMRRSVTATSVFAAALSLAAASISFAPLKIAETGLDASG